MKNTPPKKNPNKKTVSSTTSTASKPDRKDLIADLKRVQSTSDAVVTRNYYRSQGTFSEASWQSLFSTFGDFLRAAGLGEKKEPEPPAPEPPKEKEQTEVKGDQMHIALDATRICTLEQLLAHCKVDTSIWAVERFVANKWEIGAKDRDSNLKIEPLFQVKAWFKKKNHIVFAKTEIEALRLAAAQYAPKIPKVLRSSSSNGNIAEIGCPDIHIAKLAWSGETGYGNYDLDISLDRYETGMDVLVERTAKYNLDEIVLVIGNDLFHVDTRLHTTTAGTHVDTDSRYYKIFPRVRELLSRKIEEYCKIAPVRLVIVPGNHDESTTWHLGYSLECWFRHAIANRDIFIDNAPKPRKYLQHGKVMLMWTHGHKGKRVDYPLLMATDQPKMFGDTCFREIHTGHLHTDRVNEQHGVKTRILPSLCEPDYWHAENGFTGNIMSAEGFVWNKEEGLIATAVHCLPTR